MKILIFRFLVLFVGLLVLFWCLLVSKLCFLSFSTQDHVESSRNFVKNSVLEPKRAKLNQNSDFEHVRTYFWLNKSRKHKGKYIKNLVVDPKHAKLDQKSEIGHVRTCQDLFYQVNLSCFIKSSVLLNKFIIFYKIIGFTK